MQKVCVCVYNCIVWCINCYIHLYTLAQKQPATAVLPVPPTPAPKTKSRLDGMITANIYKLLVNYK